MSKSLQAFADSHPNYAFAKIDAVNGYGTQPRACSILSIAKRRPTFLAFVAQFMTQRTTFVLNLPDNSRFHIYSNMGHGQGPGEAPIAYTYGLFDAREHAL
eukprot:1164864-Karenia_brevis.AAC.1